MQAELAEMSVEDIACGGAPNETKYVFKIGDNWWYGTNCLLDLLGLIRQRRLT